MAGRTIIGDIGGKTTAGKGYDERDQPQGICQMTLLFCNGIVMR